MTIQLDEEHQLFREVFRKYVREKLVPQNEEWERERRVPKAVWQDIGAQGFLCPWVDPEYGGAGADFLYTYIEILEFHRAGCNMLLFLHSDTVVPYLATYCTQEQKSRWLPGCVSGDIQAAVAMTEPSTGSDLQSIRTTAVPDGDSYVINGQKVFISNGMSADLVVVACRTNPEGPGRKAISLIVVEDGTPGFIKARKLDKMGLHSSDTAELFFEDCRVPRSNLLGEENAGFKQLMEKLQHERLVSCLIAQGRADRVLELSLNYAKTRVAFGQPIGAFQATQFKLAEMATEVALGQAMVDELTQDFMAGTNITLKVSMGKWWITEMVNRIAYHGVQIHGGYGYMDEYEISRIYRDVRMLTIGAGTTEIMKWSIAKMMGL